MHELFDAARQAPPCVLFFDEIDALGMKRTALRAAPTMRATVNQLLLELDGVNDRNEGVFVLAASNQPWDVDSALLRPGRFDRSLLVLPPDQEARRAILDGGLRDRPVQEDIDVSAVAAATDGYSGADLVAICEAAAELAMERSLEEGRLHPIGRSEIDVARRDVRASTGAWFSAAADVAKYANEGGRYDELIAYLRTRRRL